MNDNERIMRLNSNLSKKREVGQLFKKINKLDVNIVDIKEEFIGDEKIANILNERDDLRNKLNNIKSANLFFLNKYGITIDVLDSLLLEKTLNNLCVIRDIKKDIPKYVHNDFHIVHNDKIIEDNKKKLAHLRKSGGL